MSVWELAAYGWIVVLVLITVFFGYRIVYSAIPYNGALSWKVDEWLHKREVRLEHTNIFEGGVEGILEDLDQALDLPETLYIANEFRLSFDGDGTVRTFYTFLYGMDRKGETQTYLAAYDGTESKDMTVWLDGEAGGDYSEDMLLEPMLHILQGVSWQEQVRLWDRETDDGRYEILYRGRRCFDTLDGLQYVPGGSDTETGDPVLEKLSDGGQVVGYEVSLHMPAQEAVTPVRYIMDPEYISQEEADASRSRQTAEMAAQAEEWIVDSTDGSMYYFLDGQTGWRLTVQEAAAGSRFYDLEKTENGGGSWEVVHSDPFGGQSGVAEGLIFFDEYFGVAGLASATQTYSRLYMTKDGGATFTEIRLPMESVTELPDQAGSYPYTLEDYVYLHMPVKTGDRLTIRVTAGLEDDAGIRFQSDDGGVTWKYTGSAMY